MTMPGPLDIPELSAKYITTWVKGAKTAHNLTIDWIGMWNEHWEVSDDVINPAVMTSPSQQ